MLSQPTCVGLRYGHRKDDSLEAFLGRMGSATSLPFSSSASPLGVEQTDLPIRSSYRVTRETINPVSLPFGVPPLVSDPKIQRLPVGPES